MNRFDHALQDTTRLQFPIPGREPPEGLLVMKVDLGRFFQLIGEIGRKEALLLLVIRAFRIRENMLDVNVQDVAVAMRMSNRGIIRLLDRLERQRLIVYTVKPLPLVKTRIDRAKVEFVGRPASELFNFHVKQEIPTHLIETFLPLKGIVAFLVFLYLVWCEIERPYLDMDHLVTTVQLRGRLHAIWHLQRLQRDGVLGRDVESGGLLVRDPAPPSKLERLRLRYLAIPHFRRSLVHLALLALVVLVLAGGLALLHLLPS
ncbi:MAG TPA: hypothetical protein VJ276_23760 [Thermoanaerobaculia bacterium]|nr:hypothetical protein [Thermoanaerobaculia bacterium]